MSCVEGHAHHWVVEPPNGKPLLDGECKFCGEYRENYYAASDWWLDDIRDKKKVDKKSNPMDSVHLQPRSPLSRAFNSTMPARRFTGRKKNDG